MKILQLLFGLGMTTPNLSAIVNVNNQVENKDEYRYYDYAMDLTTSHFEVDENNELVDNKTYDMSKQFQREFDEWLEYKKQNNVSFIELEHIETKFGAIDSSGEFVKKMFFETLLESQEIVVQRLDFKVYGKQSSQYKVSLEGDFYLDGTLWKNVSLLGYPENQYFTSFQIMSDFYITAFFKQFQSLIFSNSENFKADFNLEKKQTFNLDELMQNYIDYFRLYPQKYRNIINISLDFETTENNLISSILLIDLLKLELSNNNNKSTTLTMGLVEKPTSSGGTKIYFDHLFSSTLEGNNNSVQVKKTGNSYHKSEFKDDNLKISLKVVLEMTE
ncbi:hypothetical protein [Spiroplasma sp. BIUS-1]|uniref:hypothetical protein n=1 Tax=Spiroplasma sp. BIUS-1 TaxID=216964 RepID=UPI0013A68D32|nr:hypothetical protein [Spiroplasma sp. BIUS-1]